MRLNKVSLLAISSILFFSACGGGGNGSNNHINSTEPDINSYPKYSLTQDNKNDLAFMGNEERLAYDVYMSLYDYHKNRGDEIKQLYNISTKGETKHIQKVRDLINKYNITKDDLTILTTSPVSSSTTEQSALPSGKYDIDSIQNLYNTLSSKGKNSVKDALEVGCMVEVTDINDLNPKIEHAISSGAEDLEDAFVFLRDGSYNHYWSFDKGLKNIGIDSGCCSLGEYWCHKEYPQK